MNQFITRVVVKRLHGRFDIDLNFDQGVNIVHGVNGAGKTTLLHILANAVNLDLPRFTFIKFDTISVEINNGSNIKFVSTPKKSENGGPSITLFINGDKIDWWPNSRSADHLDTSLDELHSFEEKIQTARSNYELMIGTTYYPAFRTMIEAWSTVDDLEHMSQSIRRRMSRHHRPYRSLRRPQSPFSRRFAFDHERRTELARQVFGEFVPFIDYPSPNEIKRQSNHEMQRAVNQLRSDDESLLSDAFNEVFQTTSPAYKETVDGRTSSQIVESIQLQLDQLEDTHREHGLSSTPQAFEDLRKQLDSNESSFDDERPVRILRVYESILERRQDSIANTFSNIQRYITAVNGFLDGKNLVTQRHRRPDGAPTLNIKNHDDSPSSLDLLSSGERQIIGLIYSASHIAEDSSVILVDEPEISLHIDWQRKIIGAMIEQVASKQLIICTHSPVIAGEYRNKMIELPPISPISTATSVAENVNNGDDEQDWPDDDEFEDII